MWMRKFRISVELLCLIILGLFMYVWKGKGYKQFRFSVGAPDKEAVRSVFFFFLESRYLMIGFFIEVSRCVGESSRKG